MGKMCWLYLVAAVVWLGCGSEGDPVDNQDAAVYAPGDPGSDGGAGDGDATSGDGDATSGDGDATSGDGDATSGDGDASPTDGGTGGGTGGDGDAPPGNGVPNDGTHLSTCTAQDECGDGLTCLGNGGGSTGHCAEECATDKDCTDIEGLLTLCNSGTCSIDCSDGANGTSGACPTAMECNGQQICNYPPNLAAPSGQWDACEGDNECMGDLSCEGRSQSPFPGQSNPGFCTTGCSDDAECDDGGAGGTGDCYNAGFNARYCVIACANDKQCPGEMLCNGSGRCVSP